MIQPHRIPSVLLDVAGAIQNIIPNVEALRLREDRGLLADDLERALDIVMGVAAKLLPRRGP